MQYFVDEVLIHVSSGKGGAGCSSFRREKYIPYGGPDGGDGGDGGNVIFTVKNNLRTLYNLKLRHNFFAQSGQPGMGKQKNGKKGEDAVIEVPPGTVIYDGNTNEVIKDFKDADEEYVFLKGGKGGKGNMHFATSTNQAPRYAQPGLPGIEMTLNVELKLIADVGLVGFPNAGKSTLLSVVSKAKPKIANYPFTTIIPNLGVVSIADETFLMADIPGIIEGASDGHGLGVDFLKHIERTKILLFLINLEDEDFSAQYKKLKNELKKYSAELSKKIYLICATKMDLLESRERLEKLRKSIKEEIIPISSLTNYGIKELLYALLNKIKLIEKKND